MQASRRNTSVTYFEIQHYTVSEGWVSTWSDENGIPVSFKTVAAAENAFRDFWTELQDSAIAGDIEPYDYNEFRIAEILVQ